jgi:hypothetical protein
VAAQDGAGACPTRRRPRCCRSVLRATAGLSNTAIARRGAGHHETRGRQRARALCRGPAGRAPGPAPRRGVPRPLTDEQMAALLTCTLETTPENAIPWSTRSVVAACGLSAATVQQVSRLRAEAAPDGGLRALRRHRAAEFRSFLQAVDAAVPGELERRWPTSSVTMPSPSRSAGSSQPTGSSPAWGALASVFSGCTERVCHKLPCAPGASGAITLGSASARHRRNSG